MGALKIKRIYEPADKTDGLRVLVDRLWPRGMKKEAAHLDEWMKAIAPSVELRKWFNHDPDRWTEFKAKYAFELTHNDAVKDLRQLIAKNPAVTLLYAAHSAEYNHALVLQHFINAHV